MNKVMILWVGDPIGPNMGEAPSNSRRNHLAAKAMRIFDISNYKAKAQAFLEGKDAQLEDRLRACANTADKVRIVLHRVFFAFHVPCLQYNRKLTRDAVNQFFTGDPTQHPDLAAVHKAMGLCGTRKVLHDSHPLVLAAAATASAEGKPGRPFVLAPEKTSIPSSLNVGKDSCFDQFRGLLGEAFSL